MKITKTIFRLIAYWILLFLPIAIIVSTLIYGLSKVNDKFLNRNINKKFELNPIVDIHGNNVNLKFENKITIIDFWFQGCSFCVSEMNQFDALLKGRESEISVVSISIDETKYWENPNSPFSTKTVKNWNFYALDSKSIPNKRKYLLDLFRINRFPSYLVVDKQGRIIETPGSAVVYLKENYYYKNWILFFWNEILFVKDCILLKLLFLPYSILFWLSVFIVARSRKKSRKIKEMQTAQATNNAYFH